MAMKKGQGKEEGDEGEGSPLSKLSNLISVWFSHSGPCLVSTLPPVFPPRVPPRTHGFRFTTPTELAGEGAKTD